MKDQTKVVEQFFSAKWLTINHYEDGSTTVEVEGKLYNGKEMGTDYENVIEYEKQLIEHLKTFRYRKPFFY